MLSSLLPVVLAASPYFFVDGHTLVRAEVELADAPSSGRVAVRELSRRAVKLPGLVIGHAQRDAEDVAVVCPPTLQRTDAAEACEVFFIDARGVATPLGFKALSAQLLPGPHREVLLWTAALELLKLRDGRTEVLARGVLEPRLAADGKAIGVAIAPGLTQLVPGFDACPFVLTGSELRRLAGPCEAQAPFLSSSGTALWISTSGGQAHPVVDGVSLPAMPVPGRELVWLDGHRALFTARYDTDTLWVLDVKSGAAQQLGAGREPALVAGRVLAFDGRRVVQVEAR